MEPNFALRGGHHAVEFLNVLPLHKIELQIPAQEGDKYSHLGVGEELPGTNTFPRKAKYLESHFVAWGEVGHAESLGIKSVEAKKYENGE